MAFLPPSPRPVPCQVFLSIKGIYYQAEVLGQPITWITPYTFAHDVSTWEEHGRILKGMREDLLLPRHSFPGRRGRAEGPSRSSHAADEAVVETMGPGWGGMRGDNPLPHRAGGGRGEEVSAVLYLLLSIITTCFKHKAIND